MEYTKRTEQKQAVTKPSALRAHKAYLDKQDDVRFRVAKGNKKLIMEYAAEAGYASMNEFLRQLVEKETGLDLKKPSK